MRKKIISLITIIFTISIFLTGCGDSKLEEISELQDKVSNLEKVIENTVNTINDENFSNSINEEILTSSKDEEIITKYNKELCNYVFQGTSKYFKTNNRFPYSSMSCIGEVEQNNGDEKIFSYEAEIITLNDPPYETWKSNIIITENEMIETNPLSSIAKNKIQLKLPLELGNTWEQTIEYEGKTYIMKHEIMEMTGEKNKETIYVMSTIDNLVHNEKSYVEVAAYTYGRGITASDRDEGYGHGYFSFGLTNEADIEKYN